MKHYIAINSLQPLPLTHRLSISVNRTTNAGVLNAKYVIFTYKTRPHNQPMQASQSIYL